MAPQSDKARMYFEEWNEPPISAMHWAGELIDIAGGDNLFPELASMPLGRDRIVADPMEIVRRSPAGRAFPPCGTASSTRSSRR